jgi:hypothetical protein
MNIVFLESEFESVSNMKSIYFMTWQLLVV